MSLGEAFIEVRADMRPFVRDLDRQVRVAVERVEHATGQAFSRSVGDAGERAGDEAGRRAGTSFNRRLKNTIEKDKNPFVVMASALASALDDGISALPTEVKAAIVGGILLASPLVGGMLSGLITASLGVGVAGLGILLAAQFEDVRERATDFGRRLRSVLTTAAISFGPAVLFAMDLIERKIISLQPTLTRIFDASAQFLAPLTVGLTEGIAAIINMLDRVMPSLQPFIDTFSLGIQSIFETIAHGLERLAGTGEDGRQALEDLFYIINLLIAGIFGAIGILTELNAVFHDLWDIVKTVTPGLAILTDWLASKIPNAHGALAVSNVEAAHSFDGLIAATKAEEKAAKDLIKAMDGLVDATFKNIQVDIDFERSLDRITESLQENGKTLDIHTEKGRQNTEAFLKGLKDAEERALHRLQVQGYTTQQAAALYDQEIAQLRELAHNAGLSDKEFNDLFADIIAVSQLRISSEEMGVDGLASGLDDATASALALLNLMNTLKRTTIAGGIAGAKVPGYADGDIVDRPTFGMFGEDGPEVIIPLTKPARAAQLAQKSGLTTILGGNGTQVLVFIGSEQLEARMVKVVERNNKNQGQALAQGPRRF